MLQRKTLLIYFMRMKTFKIHHLDTKSQPHFTPNAKA